MHARPEDKPQTSARASVNRVSHLWLTARRHLTVDVFFVPVVLLALIAGLSIASPFFFTSSNLENLLIQASVLGITAVGATFLIICGELDLSIGSNVALSGVVATIGMTSLSSSVPVGVALGVATGIAVGVVNGVVTCWLRVASFIATLGMLVIAAGVALELTNGTTIAGVPRSFGSLANTEFLGLRTLVWTMFGIFLIGYLVLHYTAFGVRTFAVGGNREAARLSGLPVDGIRFLNFVISGFGAGVGGVMLASRVQAGQPNAGTLLTLYATAAVILGGTSLTGGRGSMWRTFLGVLLIGVVQNGLDILGVDYALQQVAVGAVFIIAASSEFVRRRATA